MFTTNYPFLNQHNSLDRSVRCYIPNSKHLKHIIWLIFWGVVEEKGVEVLT